MPRPASTSFGKVAVERRNTAVDFPETASDSPENVLESDDGGLENQISLIDGLYEKAGLVRSLRKKSARVVQHARFERATPEELSPVPPHPMGATNGVEWLRVPGWEGFSWLWGGFSTRRGGVSRAYCGEGAPGELNLGLTADDDRANVLRNRRLLAEAVTGSADTPLAMVRQIHSSVVVVGGVNSCGSSSSPSKGDGLMTAEPGVLLGIQTADCIPVLVADRKLRAVAAFHAGWRGTVKRIVENGIGRMRMEFGSRPEDLVAAIGPGIGVCCYAVGEEVLSEFESQFRYGLELFREVYNADSVGAQSPMFLTQRAPGHSQTGPALHLDLVEANRRQLLTAGVKADAIQLVRACTNCHPEMFFSHRESRGRSGRMLSVVGIRS